MRRYSLVAAIICLAACANGPTAADVGRVTVETDKAVYMADESIQAIVRNEGRESIFMHHCESRLGMLLEQKVSGEWVEFVQLFGPICPAVISGGIVKIDTGASRSERFSVSHAGEYRLRLEAGTDDSNVGMYSLVSNVFVVTD